MKAKYSLIRWSIRSTAVGAYPKFDIFKNNTLFFSLIIEYFYSGYQLKTGTRNLSANLVDIIPIRTNNFNK